MTRLSFGRSAEWTFRNAPALITVIASTILAILSGIFSFSERELLQATLLILALIGTSLVTDRLIDGRKMRTRLDEIDTKLSEALRRSLEIETAGLDHLVSCRRDLPPLEQRLLGAKRVFVSGGSLFRLVNEYKRLFEDLATETCNIRLLMTSPDSAAAEHLSTLVSYESHNVANYRAHARDTVESLQSLVNRFPMHCQARISNVAPPFSILWVEGGELGVGRLQVEIYAFGLPARDRPILILEEERDPRLYALFASQAEALWTLPDNIALDPQTTPS